MLLPDVTVDTLQPESISPKEPTISLPDVPTTVQSTSTDEKHDELLFNVDEQDANLHNPLPKILDDLNDLTFEQHDPNPNQTDPSGNETRKSYFIIALESLVFRSTNKYRNDKHTTIEL